MKLYKKKNLLDERQEQKMLQIEHRGFWLLYWLLAAEMIIKIAVTGDRMSVIGEMFCFLIVNVTVLVLSIRGGVWDRHFAADKKNYLLFAGIAAAAVFLINGLIFLKMSFDAGKVPAGKIFLMAAASAAVTYVITFAILYIVGGYFNKRQRRLEEEPEEEE